MNQKLLALLKKLKEEYSKEKAFDIIERLLEHSNEIENFEETVEYITKHGFNEEIYEQFEDILNDTNISLNQERFKKLFKDRPSKITLDITYGEDHDGGFYQDKNDSIVFWID